MRTPTSLVPAVENEIMKKFLTALSLLVVAVMVFIQAAPATAPTPEPTPVATKINWLTWEEAMLRSADSPRKLMIDVYTDWCGWCKRMDKATFQNPRIAAYVNENFYAVKLDAEQRGALEYQGKTYEFVKRGGRGYHELAALITRGQLSFPTVVFLDEAQQPIQAIGGFQDAPAFEKIVTYFGGDNHKRTPWAKYQRRYVPLREKGIDPPATPAAVLPAAVAPPKEN